MAYVLAGCVGLLVGMIGTLACWSNPKSGSRVCDCPKFMPNPHDIHCAACRGREP